YSATSILPVPCFAPTWSDEKAHPNSRSPKVHRRRVWVNSAREDRAASHRRRSGPPRQRNRADGTCRDVLRADISRNGCYGILDRVTASVRLDVGRADHLAPLLGFFDDEYSELGRRARNIVQPRSASRACILASVRTASTF